MCILWNGRGNYRSSKAVPPWQITAVDNEADIYTALQCFPKHDVQLTQQTHKSEKMHQLVKTDQLIMSCKDSTQLFRVSWPVSKLLFFFILPSEDKLGHISEADHFLPTCRKGKKEIGQGRGEKHWIFSNRYSKLYATVHDVDDAWLMFGPISCLHRLNWHHYIVFCLFWLTILFTCR